MLKKYNRPTNSIYLKVRGNLWAAEFKLLDDVWYLFESVRVPRALLLGVRDHEERWFLKEQNFVGVNHGRQRLQLLLNLSNNVIAIIVGALDKDERNTRHR
jgi:hypothetical protein